jgi:hypothetical protein
LIESRFTARLSGVESDFGGAGIGTTLTGGGTT